MTTRMYIGRAALVFSFVALASCKGPEERPLGYGGSGGGSMSGSGGRGGGGAGMGGAAAGAVPLKITWWGSPDRDTRTQKVIDMFVAKNPNISVTVEHYASTQGTVGMGYWPTL